MPDEFPLHAMKTGMINQPLGAALSRWQDISAGLSIAGLLLPEAVAYSGIANLPPQAGIIGLFAGLLCYGLLGTSRFAIVSATSSSAAVLAAATASIAATDPGLRAVLAVGLVLITGLFFLLAWLARLGSITDFIARPVLRGFSFGLALIIILKQTSAVVGVQPAHADLLHYLPELLEQGRRWNLIGIAVCTAALALLLLCSRLRRVPGGLLVIALGIAAGRWLDLQQYGIGMVGDIHLELVLPTLPQLQQAQWLRLAELGFAMVLILYAESCGAVRSFALKHGDTVSPNRDLLALGAANLVAGLFHGMPVGAGYSATSANEAAGARSRLAGLVAAGVVGLIVLTLLPVIAQTPVPVLAAVVIHAVGHTLNPAVFKPYFAWRRDRLVVIAAVLGVLLMGVLDGLLAAIAISLILMLRRLSESRISVLGRLEQTHDYVRLDLHPGAAAVSGILILRPDEALFFANAERILHLARRLVVQQGAQIHGVILSLEESPDLDSSSLEALRDFCDFISSRGQQLIMSRLKEPVHDILRRTMPGGADDGADRSGPVLSELSVAAAVRLASAAAAAGLTPKTAATSIPEKQ